MGSFRINSELRGTFRVHLLGAFGQDLGEMDLAAAFRWAAREGLDLVEVNRDTRPILCKLLNFERSKHDRNAMRGHPVRRSEFDLQDATVTALVAEGSDVLLDLDVYVHVSEGQPGVDPGEIWAKSVRITVRSARVERSGGSQRLWVSHGFLRIGEDMRENTIPTALEEAGAVELRLSGDEGSLTATGTGLKVETISEGCFVDWAE